MAALTADLFLSLDGFALGEDVGPYFGYGGPELDGWIAEELATPHLILMGRKTYVALAEMAGSDGGMDELPKAVFSNTLHEPLAWTNTRLLAGELAAEITKLKRSSEIPVRLIGSLTLVRGMIELGLVDRLRLAIFPLVLGDRGREPAFEGYPTTGFTLVGTTVLDARVLMLEYAPN